MGRGHVTPQNISHLLKLEELTFQMNKNELCDSRYGTSASGWFCDTHSHTRPRHNDGIVALTLIGAYIASS